MNDQSMKSEKKRRKPPPPHERNIKTGENDGLLETNPYIPKRGKIIFRLSKKDAIHIKQNKTNMGKKRKTECTKQRTVL